MENENMVTVNEEVEANEEEYRYVPETPEKKGFLGWVKTHKKGILGGLAAVGGGLLCFVLGAATQRQSNSEVEDDADLYDSDGNYEPTVYQFEPETDSNDEDEAV